MKIKKLTILMMASLLCFTACKNANGDSPKDAVESENAPSAVTTDNQNADDEELIDEITSEISGIVKEWKTTNIEVKAENPGIKQFAAAFCAKFDKYPPNKALASYLASPQSYDEEKTGCTINDEEKKGFISSHAMSQYDQNTDCCYWKCENGHRIVAFWLLETYEGDTPSVRKVLFYDYDSQSKIMSPRPELTDMVENAVKSADDYSVALPIDGKDIELTLFTNAEEDSYDSSTKNMVWNGNGFTLK